MDSIHCEDKPEADGTLATLDILSNDKKNDIEHKFPFILNPSEPARVIAALAGFYSCTD